MSVLEYFVVVVIIVVVVVLEGFLLVVILSFVFVMKKMMNDKAFVRNLVVCEIMGFVIIICSDKIGILIINYMIVVKVCICGKVRDVNCFDVVRYLVFSIFEFVVKILL